MPPASIVPRRYPPDVDKAIRLTKAETKKERKRLEKVEEELLAKEAALKQCNLELDEREANLKQQAEENSRQLEGIASERSKLEACTEESQQEIKAARAQLDECVVLRVEEEQRYTEAKASRELEEAKREKLIHDAERARESIKSTVSSKVTIYGHFAAEKRFTAKPFVVSLPYPSKFPFIYIDIERSGRTWQLATEYRGQTNRGRRSAGGIISPARRSQQSQGCWRGSQGGNERRVDTSCG